MRNQDVRMYLKRKGLCLWQLAIALGISESTLSRKFRNELSQDEKDAIKKIIDEMEVKLNVDNAPTECD